MNNEARSHIEKCWKGISAGLCIIERFGYILSKEFFYFCRHIIDKLVDESLATLAFNNMSGIDRGGTGVLKMDGKEVASQKMEHTIPLILQWDETFDISADAGTPVDDKDYQVPFKFSGKLNKLTLPVDRPKLTPADEKMLMEQSQRNNKTSE